MAVEEAEWAIEVMKATGKPVAVCITISVDKDSNGVPTEECALRLARSGEKIAMTFCRDDWQQGDRQTDRQTDRQLCLITAVSFNTNLVFRKVCQRSNNN